MRYAILIYDAETANPSPEPPDPEIVGQVMSAYSGYTQMLKDRGAYLGGEARQPNPTATTLTLKDGQTVTTDGPFAETKETLGGFYLVEAADLDEAIRYAAMIPGAKHGCIEVRPVWDYSVAGAEQPAAAAASN